MKINCINSNKIYYNPDSTVFKAQRANYKIKKPVLKEIESKAVYEKASDLLNKLPAGKMEKTVICNIAEKKYGIRWNTTNKDNLILEIKDKIESSDTEEWNTIKDEQSVLQFIFDANGVMRTGNITKKLKDSYSLNALYERNNNGRKTIYIDGITYRPCLNSDEYWSSLPALSCYSIKKDIHLKEHLEEIELVELFSELIDKNTTIK